jgi:hypothetical protein
MRTLLKVRIPVAAGNRAIKDGTLPQIIGTFVETFKPEASYFTAEHGDRTALFVLDVKDASDLPSLAEPFFLQLDASISTSICMNLDDMKAGIEKAARAGR